MLPELNCDVLAVKKTTNRDQDLQLYKVVQLHKSRYVVNYT